RDAHDEQLAESRIEDQFRRHARIAAAHDRRVGRLARGHRGQDLLLDRRKARLTAKEPLVARDETGQCFVCCRHVMSRGCPVAARTLLHSGPSGSIFLRAETASGMGTCVKRWFQKLTTMLVRPLIPACTALWPRSRQNAESCAVAGTLRIA